MPAHAAVEAAREQLAYWEREREAARTSNDTARLEQCDRFIAHCRLMISALTEASTRGNGTENKPRQWRPRI